MQHSRFTNVCLVLIVALLGTIAFRHETPFVHAQVGFSWKAIRVDEGNIVPQVAKETQAGWEPVAATMWIADAYNPAQGFVIFKK